MEGIEVIVFDLDNTLLLDPRTGTGSEELKHRAWFSVFSGFDPELVGCYLSEITQTIAGGKGDRRDIIRYVLKNLDVSTECSEAEIEKAYNTTVQQGICKLGVRSDVREALAHLKGSGKRLYINTGTPRAAVYESVRALGLESLFSGIYGRPNTKEEGLRTILEQEKVCADTVLVVDDQVSGLLLARSLGCRFVGMHTALNPAWHAEAETNFPVIRSVAKLRRMLA